MLLYRLSRHAYVRDLTGEGARLVGGRWNEKGIPVLYTSNTLSLAFLEVLCHMKPALIKNLFSVLVLEYNETKFPLQAFSEHVLSENWHDFPAPVSTIECGSDWLRARKSVGVRVPSAAIPFTNESEWNVLLNPLHRDFDRAVKIYNVFPFSYDDRLNRLTEN